MDHFVVYVSGLYLLCCLGILCSIVVSCWERWWPLGTLVRCVFLIFVTFPIGVPGSV